MENILTDLKKHEGKFTFMRSPRNTIGDKFYYYESHASHNASHVSHASQGASQASHANHEKWEIKNKEN